MGWEREIAWQRFDERGEERAGFACQADGCGIEGVGAIAINGYGMVFQYRIECETDWSVRRAGVVVKLGTDDFTLLVERRDEHAWLVNGNHDATFDGCSDLVLSFTPSTMTPVIKRLMLPVGESFTTRALLVQEPELALAAVDLLCRRIDERHYEWRVGEHGTIIAIDEADIVIEAPGLFEAILQTA